jgi:predicted ATPase
VVIRTPDQRLRVFVSSTMGELAVERRAVARAITALRLTPVLFEAGARPHPPRELYQAYLAQSDVFIGIYWQRYGQVNAGMEVSGLEEEFLLSGTGGLPRLLYVKTPAPDREPRLAELLARISQEASYRRFSTPAELGRLVRDDLAALLSERFAAGSAASAASSSPGPRRLPAGATSLVGREQDIDGVAGLLGRPEVRLVTLTGPGGVGKTRLALAVGELLRDRFDEVVFVPLETATRREQVLAGIARAVGADLAGTDSPLQVLVEQLAGGRWLLILDNLEQVLDVAGDIGELLARSPHVTILATSRTVLGLRAEHDYPVPPLLLADDPTVSAETLIASPAVALFVDRARAVRPGFALTEGNAAAVAEICRRLEGLPLAIELAAARTRLLDPDELLRRLATSLDALGTGPVDLPQRQRTLRDTVQWSVDLLDDNERSLLETMAIFMDGWTVDAAGQVAGLAEDRVLDLSEALARSSLIQLDSAEPGPRLRMLNVIRRFVAERLAARPDVAEIGRRHADYYQALAERADRPLRGLDQDHAAEGLEAEAANLAAAVDWYLAHDAGRCRICSGSCGYSGGCGTTWVRLAAGSTSCCPPPARGNPTPGPSCCGRQRLLPWRWWARTRRRRPASASNRCWPGSAIPTCTRCPSWPWRASRRSSATSTAPCDKSRPAWRSSAVRTSRTGRPWPPLPTPWWRRPWDAPTPPSATCARRGPWRGGSTTPGSARGPRCS